MGRDVYRRIEPQTYGSGEPILEADGETVESELQTSPLDHGRIQLVTHGAKASDDGFKHLLDLDGAWLQFGGLRTEVEAQGVELQADGAQHLADFVVQKTGDPPVLGFTFGDKAEQQLLQSSRC
jgi:hypothetical protein